MYLTIIIIQIVFQCFKYAIVYTHISYKWRRNNTLFNSNVIRSNNIIILFRRIILNNITEIWTRGGAAYGKDEMGTLNR